MLSGVEAEVKFHEFGGAPRAKTRRRVSNDSVIVHDT